MREDNIDSGLSTTFDYDAGGNILNKKEYSFTLGALTGTPTTKTYSYGTTGWKDKLLSYSGYSGNMSYDAGGNPTVYNGFALTWEKGRQLKQAVSGNTVYSYAYNGNGVRTSKTKTVNGATTEMHEYLVKGSDIQFETVEIGSSSYLLNYIYDNESQLVGVICNNELYYYVKNLQGDVIKLIDSNGNVVVKYGYDAWGKLLYVKDDNGNAVTSATHVGNLNSFRYRGYCADSETGFYYLQTRYYDPELGRFMNADRAEILTAFGGTLQEKNLFAYCNNDPVNFCDPIGCFTASIAISLSLITKLSALLSGIIAGIKTSIISIKAAIATSWFIIICIAATAIAIIGIVYTVNRVMAVWASALNVIASVKACIKKGGVDPKTLKNDTVYVIVPIRTDDVIYAGRTKNFTSRMNQHKRRFPDKTHDKLAVATGLSLSEARAMEQTIITAYTLDTLKNMINSISPSKWANFKKEFSQMQTLIESWNDPE